VARNWVIDEADQGQRHGVLVSVLIDEVDMPLGFGQGQAADLTTWNGQRADEEVDRLVQGIRRLVRPSQVAPPPRDTGTRGLGQVLDRSQRGLTAERRERLVRHPALVPTLLLAAVFAVNLLQTALDRLTTPSSLGAQGGYPVAEAFRWFERYLSFEGHDATNAVAYVGYSVSYFFVFPAMLVGVALALARRRDPRPYRTLSLAVAINYLVSLPFFFFLPVPERWFQPQTSAILLSDKWSDALIEAIRPMSGLDNSFPSFHVSLTVLVVTACYVFDVRLRTCVAALGATVVLSTFVLGIHWLPDIIAGACLGVISLLSAWRLVREGTPAALWQAFASR
jgi:membrane-associated phospholipid phosphatase